VVGHQRAPKRYALALLFPCHTDPPKFWLLRVAKNYPFAIDGPIHDRSDVHKGEINSLEPLKRVWIISDAPVL
jgi:hypothetical protein